MFFYTLSDFWYNWNIIHGVFLLFLISFFLALFLQISFFSLLVRSLQLWAAVGLIYLFILQLKNIVILPGFFSDLKSYTSKTIGKFNWIDDFGSTFIQNNNFFEPLMNVNKSTTLWFSVDYDPFYNFLIIGLLVFMILLFLGLSDYMLLKENYRVEYPLMFFLIFISGIGLLLSNDIISILICLECITFSGYILVGFDKTRRLSAAAGIRYLILGSIPSAFLVIGLAFLYSNFGIFSKDALELISSSFLEPSIFLKDKFNNLDNLLKYNFIGDNEKIIYKTISDGKDNAKFYIDFGWLDVKTLFPDFIKNVNNNNLFLNYDILTQHTHKSLSDNGFYDLNYNSLNHTIFDHNLTSGQHTNTRNFLISSKIGEDISNSLLNIQNHNINHLNFFNKINNNDNIVLHFTPIETTVSSNNDSGVTYYTYNLLHENDVNLKFIDTNSILNSNEFLISLNKTINLDTITLMKSLLLFQISAVLILINLLFKVTGAPFHVWAPTIYTNAPTMSVIFLSIFVKLIIFSFILVVFVPMFYTIKNVWGFFLFIVGVLSIISGLLGAFNELMLKRFLIYSSVGHVGFIILGLPFIFIEGNQAMLNYLYVYSLTSIILWLIVTSNPSQIKFLTNLKTILMRNMLLSIIFTFVVFSMSGIPPLAGFFVKFDILLNLMKSTNLLFVWFILLLTVITFFYYLRMIKIIFFENIFWENTFKHLRWSDGRFFIIALTINVILLYSILVERGFSFYVYKLLLFSL